jgi:pimeloyl-ACP methyl ester carboxylesterase/RimJ/RimL family protein N-acetyltransferase
MDWPPHGNLRDALAIVERAACLWESGEEYSWVITVRPDDRAMGNVGCRVRGHAVELGYVISRDYWGRGYATEAAKAVFDWAAAVEGVYRVWATCDVENTASVGVLEKIGMSREGVLRCWAIRPNIDPVVPRDALISPGYARHENGREMRMSRISGVVLGVLLSTGALHAQQVETGFLRVGSDSIYFEVAGAGAAVILMHDGLVHSATWREQFPALADTRRVVRFDRRGYGRSSTPTAPFSMVEDLRMLQDHLGISSAVLIAASAGGAMAIDFALAYPERVNGLVLVGAVVLGAGFSDHFLERNARNSAPLQSGDTAAAYERWLNDPYIMSPSSVQARKRLVQDAMPYATKHLQNSQRFVQWRQRNVVALLPSLTVPCRIVVGEDDIPDVHAHAGILAAGITGSRRVVVAGAGHLVFAEQPEQFNALVREFLDEVLKNRQ